MDEHDAPPGEQTPVTIEDRTDEMGEIVGSESEQDARSASGAQAGPADTGDPGSEASPYGVDLGPDGEFDDMALEGELGPDPLASLDEGQGAFVLGFMPILIIALLAAACFAVYTYKRRKSWNELDEDLKIDGGDAPLGSAVSAFSTQELSELDATRPSQRIQDLKD